MATIQHRRGTAAQWTTANRILAAGEIGVETDTGKIKVGDGTTPWATLDYLADEGGGVTGPIGIGDVIGLSAALTAKADDTDLTSLSPVGHSHTIANITGLQDALTAAGGAVPGSIPILTIDTGGVPILNKETWVPATYILDGQVIPGDIRGRGNSTWTMPKKPYNMRLTSTTSLLGMTGAKRWSLLANYADVSMIRNTIALEIGSRMAGLAWTPHSRFVTVVLNGVDQGLYLLIEPVRMETGRVAGSAASGSTGLALTGNYLLESDFHNDAPKSWFTAHDGLSMMMDTPDGTDATHGENQFVYIRNWIDNFESVLYGAGWLDPTTGYASLIDRASFIDFYLVAELCANVDAGLPGSVKLVKTRDTADTLGRLFLGPLWDYDLSMGKTWNTYSPEGWWVRDTTQPVTGATQKGMPWIRRMMDDPDFKAALVTRWGQMVTLLADLPAFIDRMGQMVAIQRRDDYIVWEQGDHVYTTWKTETAQLKTWIAARMTWITANIGTIPDTEPPSAPTDLAASSITDTTVTLTWTAATDNVAVTGYRVLVDSEIASTIGNVTTTTVSGLTAETEYSMTVQARDAAGNWSDESDPLPVTTDEASESTLPEVRASFDWHEGSGATTTSVAGTGTNPLNASVPLSAWSGEAAVGRFGGSPFWNGAVEDLQEWSWVFDFTLAALPGSEQSLARAKNAHLNVTPNGAVKTYPSITESAAGKWTVGAHRVAWIMTSTGQKVYIDGVLAHTDAVPVTINTSSDGMDILLSALGTVDNLDLYAVALTDEQAIEATT